MAERSTASRNATGLAALLFAGLSCCASDVCAATASAATSGAPVISGTSTNRVVAGDFYEFRPTASDPNDDPLVFSINKLPEWARFNTATGRLYGTPKRSDADKIRHIVISVSDGTSTVALPKFRLKVVRGKAPKISGAPATRAAEGKLYAFQPVAIDPDDQAMTFAIINKPTWATFSTKTGRLAGTPGPGTEGAYAGVGISVTDGAATRSLQPFTIDVTAWNNSAPTITGTSAASVQAGKTYVFQPSAADIDGDTLTFSVVNLPSWASFSSATGRISGTPQAGNEGTYPEIVVSVSDGTDVSFLPMFAVTVTAASLPKPTPGNDPPTISGTPSGSVTIGQAYAFRPTASDPDGQALTFSISNQPAWASFSSSTGRLSGTPTAADAGTWSNIVISVTDGQATTSLPAFSIAVNQVADGAATISWVPPTENTDDSAITDLAGYRIRYGLAPNALTKTVTIPNVGVTSAVIENLGAGTWYFGVVAYNAAAVESAVSGLAQKTIN